MLVKQNAILRLERVSIKGEKFLSFSSSNTQNHNFYWKNFKILNAERKHMKRDISEML